MSDFTDEELERLADEDPNCRNCFHPWSLHGGEDPVCTTGYIHGDSIKDGSPEDAMPENCPSCGESREELDEPVGRWAGTAYWVCPNCSCLCDEFLV